MNEGKMICLNCGNTKQFYQIHNMRIHASECAFINGDCGDIEDWDHFEENDRETIDTDDTQCSKCDSADIEIDLSDTERVDIIWKHTDKNGEWHEQELPEKERDSNILEEHAIKLL